jgi:hypothetical protein
MSSASEARVEGFSALLDADGETLTFRGASVVAHVNRKPNLERAMPGKIEFRDPVELSIIQFALDAFPAATPPKVSEAFKDGFGYYHKILKAPMHLGHCYQVLCSQTT